LAPVFTKSFVGWGFAPDPTGVAYSAPPDSLAVFKWRGEERRGEEERGGREFILCPRRQWRF